MYNSSYSYLCQGSQETFLDIPQILQNASKSVKQVLSIPQSFDEFWFIISHHFFPPVNVNQSNQHWKLSSMLVMIIKRIEISKKVVI
jgi:hypothetical protein